MHRDAIQIIFPVAAVEPAGKKRTHMKDQEDWQKKIFMQARREEIARQILGVQELDGPEQIKQAWRRLCFECHPDLNASRTDAHDALLLINAAYRCLNRGRDCEQLDALGSSADTNSEESNKMGNSWKYFLWWRDRYSDIW